MLQLLLLYHNFEYIYLVLKEILNFKAQLLQEEEIELLIMSLILSYQQNS